jgi:ketosteroid isomerase-like protein
MDQNKRRTEMSEIKIEIAAQGEVICTVLMHLENGEISDATACFADKFEFKDRGIGLEFKDREHLEEFFQKTRELYPDSSLQTDTIFVSGDHVITEWTLRTTITEPFYGGLPRKVPVSLHGASIVRIHDGKITDWSDYYDGLTSRRTALASYFTEWVGL